MYTGPVSPGAFRGEEVTRFPYSSIMIRAPAEHSATPAPAYSVPLRVDRSRAPTYSLTNVGNERITGVTFCLLGSGVMPARAPLALEAGAATTLTIRGDDLARRTVLVVRWFRPDGDEYLWRVSF